MSLFWTIVGLVALLVGLALAPFVQEFVVANALSTGTPLDAIVGLLPFAFIGLIIIGVTWGVISGGSN